MVLVLNITDVTIRRTLLTSSISILYSISNQALSSSSVLGLLTTSAIDGSFATSLSTKVSARGTPYTLTVSNPIQITSSPTLAPTVAPSVRSIKNLALNEGAVRDTIISVTVVCGLVIMLGIAYFYYYYLYRRKLKYV